MISIAIRSRLSQTRRISAPVLLLSIVATSGILSAQDRDGWTVKPRESLAWWQVEPNHGHLWATTCPGDPSWSAGESRSSGYAYRDEGLQTSTANHNSRVPLFPRGAVTPVCREAVSGSISIGDTTRWSGVKGAIVVEAGELTTGADFRDAYARKAVLQTQAFPRIEFDIDSLTQIQVQGDTIRAFAVGTFKLLGKAHLKTGRVVAWRVPEGLRVRAQIEIPAKDMINVYGMSKIALNLGVVLGRWDTLHMGIDIILASTNTAL